MTIIINSNYYFIPINFDFDFIIDFDFIVTNLFELEKKNYYQSHKYI
jgi:hypothetical protein